MLIGALYQQDGDNKWFIKQDSGSSTKWKNLQQDAGELHYDNADWMDTDNFTTGNNASFDGGGSLAGTFSRSTTAADIVRGSACFKLVGDATAGNNDNDYIASEAKSIPQGFRGQIVYFSFHYKWDGSGNNINFVVNDDTNSVDLSTEVLEVSNGSDNVAKKFIVGVRIPTDCLNVKYGFQVVTGEVSRTLIWDEVKLSMSPSESLLRENINVTPWESFTPTGTWTTNSTYSGYKRRVGDTMEVRGTISLAGAPTASALRIDIPDNLQIDTGKIPDTTSNETALGFSTLRDNSAGNTLQARAVYFDANQVRILSFLDVGTSEEFNNVSSTSPFTFASGDSVHFEFSVPIDNWEVSNDMTVSPSDNVAPSKILGNVSTNIASSTKTYLGFTSIAFDDDNLFSNIGAASSTTYTNTTYWTCPQAGYYRVKSQSPYTADGDLDQNETLRSQIEVNGSGAEAIDEQAVFGTLSSPKTNRKPDTILFLNKGDIVSIAVYHEASGSISPIADNLRSWFEIYRIDKSPVIATGYESCVLRDEKSAGTNGGSSSGGTWATRDLNAQDGGSGFCSLSSNQFILQSGSYKCLASAPAHLGDQHKIRLRNITDSVTTLVGSNGFGDASTADPTDDSSFIKGRFTITKPTTFEIQHRVATTRATNGFGVAASMGEVEVYTQVEIIKEK